MGPDTPINIGLLYSFSGVTAAQELSQWRGATQAIAEINQNGGINGRPLNAIHLDPQSDDVLFRAMAEELITEHEVNVIFGGYTSSSRKAMSPIVEKYRRLLFYSQLYEGFEFSENIFYGGAAPNQNCVQLADYLAAQFGARVYLIGSRYIYPYECNRNMQELILQRHDGAVIGERYLDLNAPYEAFLPIIDEVMKKQPDFIFSTVVGQTVPFLYQAYKAAGLDPARMPIGSLNTSETEIAIMGAEAAKGHFTSAPYFQSINTKANQSALKQFRKQFGPEMSTDMNWEATYSQVHLFAKAMAECGSDHIYPLSTALGGSQFDAPQGRIRIDQLNQHTGLYPRIGMANENGQFTIVQESRRIVDPDPYMTNQIQGDWVTKLTTVGYPYAPSR
ncbi:transporter substrate-binding protein [Klebsiella michiganensis]|jgi:branched-chain amino acid transport system substrate-binding protein|uniref:transporter substrate-binding domain-containing protein n=1 Tax=Klebsiella/Raoultella group TaxID=2890311 RepID=UPI00044BA271|nr:MULTISPECIES: transporter substrate-binding domain-containing protein [Klebsiella/Raoultella group]HDX8330968.1 transporter substrate-binding domain-containing protein [Raoultella ornithinolytica CD1_MRS_4]EKR9386367.1 transporter substrate-binding domain-containing protein [Raoultella ornithinolytica]EUB38813.1 putative aliphatic amidase expression-regulating protein [Klebsiella sp. AS10]KAB8128637.1 transporter substrate-binding protein [Raoultella ornithinolytica]MBG2572346.1 transporter